ncbi:hypothetical protein H0H92_015765, partial [Tricholoma furcatifolium]
MHLCGISRVHYNYATGTPPVTEANERQYLHDQFEAGLIVPVSSQAPVVGTAHEAPSSQLVNEWKIQLEAWENDHSKPNPYEKEYTSISQDAVRRELAEKEAIDLATGIIYALHDQISGAQLIMMGLDLEEK